MKLSHLSETLIGSEIVRLGNEISERMRNGEKFYNFTIGDFDPSIFPIPRELEEEIITAYRNHFTNYPAADGIADLRKAVSGFMKAQLDLDYAPNEILIAAGGRPLIYAFFRAIVDKGEKVVYAVPSWNNNHYTHFNEGEHTVVETRPENRFMPTAEELQPHIGGASLLALCSPLNPTGTTFAREQLEAICDMVLEENSRRGAEEKKLYVMYDQIYWTLTFGETQHYNPVQLRPEMRQYTVFVDGISKAFAATGVRVGWSLGPAPIIAKMKAILSHVGAWSPMAEQNGAARYLLQIYAIQNYLAHFKRELSYRLDKLYQGFMQLKAEGLPVDAIAPEAAIYLTISIDLTGRKTTDGQVLHTQTDTAAYLLNEARLAVVPFSFFGASKNMPWYRLSVGTCRKEEIDEVFRHLREAILKTSPVE